MTTSTLTLTAFLLARLAEDEADALAIQNCDYYHGVESDAEREVQRLSDPARVLAECAAKRAIVDWHKSWPVLVETPPTFEQGNDINSMTMKMSQQVAWLTQQQYVARFGTEPPSAPILRHLAAVYSDHADYDPSWAMS